MGAGGGRWSKNEWFLDSTQVDTSNILQAQHHVHVEVGRSISSNIKPLSCDDC